MTAEGRLFDFLDESDALVRDHLSQSVTASMLQPEHLRRIVWTYINRPAKRLRPAVLLMAAGAVGADYVQFARAAAGLEVFHTWTLLHDDIIDNDTSRRGLPSAHEEATAMAAEEFGISREAAQKYGRDLAMLAGDMQHGWATSLFLDCVDQSNADPRVVMAVVQRLQTTVLSNLIFGEILDVQYSLLNSGSAPRPTEADVVRMLWLKTGALYEFAGFAGATLGSGILGSSGLVAALEGFASACGTAFQLQDDILGILGDESALGKPVGSDIREGKTTVIVLEAFANATEHQARVLSSILGNQLASAAQIAQASTLLVELGGIARAVELAGEYVEKALPFLDVIPSSRFRALLEEWAAYMVSRRF